MKTQLLRVALLLWALTQTGSLFAQEDDVSEIRSLLERMAELMQAGDLESLGQIYAPGQGVHIIEGTGVNHGWEDYRDNHLAPELAAFNNFTIRYFAIEPQVRAGIAYSAFRYELSADIESGHIEIEGRGTAILERMNGRWRIVHTHTSGRSK